MKDPADDAPGVGDPHAGDGGAGADDRADAGGIAEGDRGQVDDDLGGVSSVINLLWTTSAPAASGSTPATRSIPPHTRRSTIVSLAQPPTPPEDPTKNTSHLGRHVFHGRKGELYQADAARLSAYQHKHINVHGHYSFGLPDLGEQRRRPLRDPDQPDE